MVHYARYIRPGAQRVGTYVDGKGITAVAFRNPDGSFACVIINLRWRTVPISLEVDGKSAHFSLPRKSLVTAIWN